MFSFISPYVRILSYTVLVCFALIGLTLLQRVSARSTEIKEAHIETINLTRSLTQHAYDALKTADMTLLGLRDVIDMETMNAASFQHWHGLMKMRIDSLPMLHGLFFFDHTGMLQTSSLSSHTTNVSYHDRPYFKYFQEHSQDVPHVVGPLRSKTDGTWILVISRRVNHLDGTLKGILSATISTDFFQKFYDTFSIGKHGAITLFQDTGTIIVRKPFDLANVGKERGGSLLFQQHINGSSSGTFIISSSVDGVERLGSFRRIEVYPLILTVAFSKEDVLFLWRQETFLQGMVVLATIVILMVLGHYLARQFDRRQRIEALYRLIADHSSDAIVCTGLDGCRHYISPSFTTMTGWSQEELLSKTWESFVYPPDHEIVKNALASFKNGVEHSTCTYRYLCKDGRLLWVEARIRLISGTRSGLEYVGNIRDISRSKEAEERLAALNKILTSLSITDALTGLANRRHFDEILSREWGIAGGVLSLLLLDADHFKAYNDHYGHPKGDEVLRQIANCIQSNLRATDTAARYGGEEFAVVLPMTGSDTAYRIGERIRLSLFESGIKHEISPNGYVTLSVGVASLHPFPEGDPATLTSLADAALYRAKQSRNRTVIFKDIH